MAIDKPLIAPWTSPICLACEVPTAWADVPMATPWATGSVILNIFIIVGAITAPVTPLKTTVIAVTAAIPWYSSDKDTAMAVVIDCGISDVVSCSVIEKTFDKPKAKIIEKIDPTSTPTKTGRIFFFSVSKLIYRSIIIATVAGPMKKAMKSPPFL